MAWLVRRRSAATRPAVPLGDVAEWNAFPSTDEFLTGNGFAAACGHILNYGEMAVNPRGRPHWYFCRTPLLGYFFEEIAPRHAFVLVTHNGDDPIDAERGRHLRSRRLRAWFSANVAIDHPKLHPIPAGIANPRWPHGDPNALRHVQCSSETKRSLFDASFSIDTNPEERRHCVEQTGIAPSPRKPYRQYLEGLASAYFCLSPRGNGIDCHRTWEALYVRTVPVVTRSVLTDRHPGLPLLVLDDWSDFGSIDFSPALYARIWGGWDPQELSLPAYLERMTDLLDHR